MKIKIRVIAAKYKKFSSTSERLYRWCPSLIYNYRLAFKKYVKIIRGGPRGHVFNVAVGHKIPCLKADQSCISNWQTEASQSTAWLPSSTVTRNYHFTFRQSSHTNYFLTNVCQNKPSSSSPFFNIHFFLFHLFKVFLLILYFIKY